MPCLCGLCGCRTAGQAQATTDRNLLYDKFFASAMKYGMDEYEAAIKPIKTRLFQELVSSLVFTDVAGDADGARSSAGGPKKVLEVGIGTGPNLPFYVAALTGAVFEEAYGPP